MGKSHDTSLTQLAQWITRTLKAMVPVSEQIWRNLFLVAGIVTDGSWVIKNSARVREKMRRMDLQGLSSKVQQTYDFHDVHHA